jgi:SulP family sulfate permease
LANLGSGFLHGIPVGGSVSATALNQTSGARSRWASILSGVWIALILVALSPLIGEVVVATLAAVLMYVGVSSIKPKELLLAWHTGSMARVGMAVTFVSTLALPIAAAVAVGIIVSLMMQLNRESLDLKVVQLIREDGRLHERPAPGRLEDRQLVVLEVYGSLLYAGSHTLRRLLPDPIGAQSAVVVLRLRGHSTLGATFFSVIAGYAELLSAGGGRLYLSGVDPAVVARFEFVLAPDTRDDVQVFQATEIVGDSTVQAVEAGRAFLVGQSPATGPR